MNNPLFSVILPSRNGEDRIRTALNSIKTQTFTDYELIVVCDSCDDNTENIAKEYTDNVIVTNCRRDGLARNAGINASKGQWLLFIDDDDYFLHEYCFEKLADKIRETNNIKPDIIDFSFVWKGRGYMIPSVDETFVMAWCRAWKREFIGDNRFDNSTYGSDLNFFKQMVQGNDSINIYYWDFPMYYYDYMRKGSMTDIYESKTLLDIIVTCHDEPIEIYKRFFDMVEYQRQADKKKFCVTVVYDGFESKEHLQSMLSGYTFRNKLISTCNLGPAAARNVGMKESNGDFIMFCDIDDMFNDLCAISMIISQLPTDTCDVIWGSYISEMVWRKGKPYLQVISTANFINTIFKMYSRKFLEENNITFEEDSKYCYEYIFNAIILNIAPPFRVKQLTTDFMPYIKTYRKGSLKTTEDYYVNIGQYLADANISIAGKMLERGNYDAYRQFIIKVICLAYRSIYDPCTNEYTGMSEEFIRKFCIENSDVYKSVPDSDIDVLCDEAETQMMNFIQRIFNEYGKEFYFRNDKVSFSDWINKFYEQEQIPAPAETPLVSLSVPHVVVYCGTRNVYEDMMTSCKSIMYHTPIDKVYFLIEDDEFPYPLPDVVETINISGQTVFKPDGPNFDNAWTYMCMMRAMYPSMFSEYNKILSLDIDIIAMDNVSDLWDYDLTDYYMAGVPERQRQNTPDDPAYINFGVVMMNLANMRRDNIQQQVVDALNTRKIDCPEQTAFNEACAHHILELPNDLNATVYSHITGQAEKERILHYAGQTFWKHYSNVKKYGDLTWDEIMERQAKLHG